MRTCGVVGVGERDGEGVAGEPGGERDGERAEGARILLPAARAQLGVVVEEVVRGGGGGAGLEAGGVQLAEQEQLLGEGRLVRGLLDRLRVLKAMRVIISMQERKSTWLVDASEDIVTASGQSESCGGILELRAPSITMKTPNPDRGGSTAFSTRLLDHRLGEVQERQERMEEFEGEISMTVYRHVVPAA